MGTTDWQRPPRGPEGSGQVASPVFTPAELQRLRFTAYRWAQGYLRPVAAVRPGVERLCDEITAYLRTPPLRLRQAPAGGVPPLWRAWVAAHQHPTPPAQSA